jgi:uncharacterized protein (TIGR02246 family)
VTDIGSAMNDRPGDDQTIEGVYRQMTEAWNRHDAAAMAECFTQDAEVVGFDGSLMRGREEIRVTMGQLFNEFPMPAFVVLVRGIRKISVHAGILTASVGTIAPGENDIDPAGNSVNVAVIAAQPDGQWRIESLQSTPAAFHGRPELAQELTDELRAVHQGSSSAR